MPGTKHFTMNKRPTQAQARTARRNGSLTQAARLGLASLAVVLPLMCNGRGAWAADAPAVMPTEPALPNADAKDGPAYTVTEFVISYAYPREGLPPIESIQDLQVELGRVADGLVQWREGLPKVRFRLADAGKQLWDKYYLSALLAIDAQITQYINGQGLIGVFVGQDHRDINPMDGKDLRGDRKSMKIQIVVGAVKEVRTIGAGDRVKAGERINNPAHTPIKEGSPVKPAGEGTPAQTSLLKKDALDEYVYRLNRHPGRRVDVALAAAQEPGGVALDYLVSESKPWTVYAQVSNTGTEQTSEWRERVGFVHNNLTNHDDIFSFDFVTAAFDESNAVLASYEAPLFKAERMRWKIYGTWSEFTASDIGRAGQDFDGEEYALGGELIANIFQKRELFVDLVGGLRFKNIQTSNSTDQEGQTDLWEPYVGLRLDRMTEKASTTAGLTLVYANATDYSTTQSGVSSDKLDGLGRVDIDDEYWLLQADVTQSIFLEPLLWKNYTTLAHELLLRGRWQHAFGYRVVPQEQDVLGGLYTVRGYDDSLVSGDNLVAGTIEYRWHIPRSFKVNPDPSAKVFGQPFRWAPQQPYGRPDWDLILKGFFDAGHVSSNDKPSFEDDYTMMSVGVGIEFQFKQNLTLRLDYGVALRDVHDQAGDQDVESGDSRLHVVFTVMY